jgi:hypothetical protein
VEKLILVVNTEPPSDLLRALRQAASEDDITINDVARELLSEHFGREYGVSGRSFRESKSVRLKISVPPRLHRQLRREAVKRGGTLQGVTLSILAQMLGTSDIYPHRRPRRK